MTCEEALILLSGQIDSNNTTEETAQLQQHLQICAECRQALQAFEEIDCGIASLEVEPPADLKDSVMDAIRAEAKPRKKRRWWPPVAAAAVLFLVIGLGAGQLKQVQQQTETEPMTALATADTAAPAAYARSVENTPAYEEANSLLKGKVNAIDPQTLADARGADVAVTRELLQEMEVCDCETLEDCSLLALRS